MARLVAPLQNAMELRHSWVQNAVAGQLAAYMDLKRLSEHLADVAKLRQRLQTIRREGFGVSIGETVPGAAGIAAPIFNADGSVTAGLLIAAPIERFEKQLPRFKRLLQEATSIVSGITPPPAATGSRQARTRAARAARAGD